MLLTLKLKLPPSGYMPLCNMQLVDSQYNVIWKKGWLVFVAVLAVLWCRHLVCNKYRIEELQFWLKKLWELVVLVMKYRRQMVK